MSHASPDGRYWLNREKPVKNILADTNLFPEPEKSANHFVSNFLEMSVDQRALIGNACSTTAGTFAGQDLGSIRKPPSPHGREYLQDSLSMTIDLMHTVVGFVFLAVWAAVGQVMLLKK